MSFNGNLDGSLCRLEPLVEGGNSDIYEIITPLKGRSHVLKSMQPSETNQRMHRVETEVYKLLQKSPRKIVPELVRYGNTDEELYIILEKARTDLLYLVMEPGPEVNFCKKCVLRSVTQAVMDLHARKVAHLDIKPENVLISDSGEIWLCDFGCSVICKSYDGTYSGNVGTCFYSAPEITLSNNYNPFLADIWSVTMLFYVMLTNVFPYTQKEIELLEQRIDVISEKNFNISLEATKASDSDKAFLKRILEKRPTFRKSLAEILQDSWFDCDDYHIVEFKISDQIQNPKKRRCTIV